LVDDPLARSLQIIQIHRSIAAAVLDVTSGKQQMMIKVLEEIAC